MSSTLTQIKAPIIDELNRFGSFFKKEIKSEVRLLDKVSRFVIRKKGKQLRPLLVFLSAKVCGKTSKSTYTAATILELLHTATLVHDDVEDGIMKRKGLWSFGPLWKSKIAVLLGDYLLSQGLLVAIRHREHRLLEMMSNAIESISEGELLRIDQRRSMDINETTYFDIIEKKTASLIGVACASGAISVCASDEVVERIEKLGRLVGLAFQIRADLIEFGEATSGKIKGFQTKNEGLTLPLVHALSNADQKTMDQMLKLVLNSNGNSSELDEVRTFVDKHNGTEKAKQSMLRIKGEAIHLLQSLPSSPARSSFEILINQVTAD